MKKLFLAVVLLSSVFSFAQNFPYSEIQLLLNKEIKVKPKSEGIQKYGYDDFYKDEKLKTKFACCDSYNSKYLSLVNKTFVVISYQPYKNLIGTDKFKMLIRNAELGDLYFDYDPNYDFKFPFEVIGGLTFPDGYYCNKITKSIDKFTNEVTEKAIHKNVSILKISKDNSVIYYLSIRTSSSTCTVGEKGLILLLDNGTKINFSDAKIDVDVNTSKYGSGFIYSSFVRLSDSDLKSLLANKITDARLYIYDTNLVESGSILQDYLKCLTK